LGWNLTNRDGGGVLEAHNHCTKFTDKTVLSVLDLSLAEGSFEPYNYTPTAIPVDVTEELSRRWQRHSWDLLALAEPMLLTCGTGSCGSAKSLMPLGRRWQHGHHGWSTPTPPGPPTRPSCLVGLVAHYSFTGYGFLVSNSKVTK
jgi:hypothetical protein